MHLASNRNGKDSGKRRSFAEEIQFIKRIDGCHFSIKKGFVERMQVEGRFYVNRHLEKLMFDELRHHVSAAGVGGFLPGSRCCLPAFVSVTVYIARSAHATAHT